MYLCAAYIPPTESPYYKPDIYEILQREVSHFQSQGRVLLYGDLNARTGTEKDYLTSEGNSYILGGESYYQEPMQTTRNSYDKTVNKSGKALLNLCRSLGLYIMNGRTRGDSLGRFTMNSHVGSSVVDYAITDTDPINLNALIVTPETHLSDHNQILLYLKSTDKPTTQQPHQTGLYKLPPSFKWPKQSATEYTNTTKTAQIQELLINFYTNPYEPNQQGVSLAVKDFSNILYTMAVLAGLKQTNYKRSTNKQSEKWFDRECKALRNSLRAASNQKHRDPNNRDLREAHDHLQRQYKDTLRRKKANHISHKLQQLEDSLQDNSFWETWNHIGAKPKKSPPHIQNGHIWLHYFRDLYKDIPENAQSLEQKQLAAKLKDMEETIKDFQSPLDTPITVQEIRDRIKLIKCKKASGTDGILPEMIKHSSPDIHEALARLFNLILSAGSFPQAWSEGLITPIYKNGDRYDPANYRGICVSSTLGKLFNSIINKRILSFLTQQDVISKSQAGFMPNHRTTDHIYTLHSLIKTHVHSSRGKIHACFVDFKKAFDSVWHPGLFLKLLESGIGGRTYDVIKSSYTGNQCSVKVDGKRSAFFKQGRGVRQGCSLSPTLFNIYINQLAVALESSQAPGLLLHDREVKFLLYADDLLLLSPTEKGLQDSLAVLESFCTTWALPINPKKTKVMVFQRKNLRKPPTSSFILNGSPLVTTNSYTYLGLEINQSGSFKPAVEALKEKACRTFYAIRKQLYHLKAPVRVWVKIFDSIITPILLYSSEVWGPVTYPDQSKWDTSPTEIFHLEFCKYLLQVHRSTSNSACRAELGRFPLWLTIQQRALSYWAHIQNSSPSTYHHKASLSQGAEAIPHALKQSISNQPSQNLQHRLTKAQIKGTIESCKERYLEEWKSDIKNSQKLTVYQLLQREYTMAPYLERLHHHKDRQTLSRYRLSAHSLEIETGRHKQTLKPREERLCRQCDQGVLEDEAHFLLHCSKYAPVRIVHFQKFSDHIQDFTSTDDERKLYILLGEEEATVQIAARYVAACHQLRGT